MQPTNVVAAAGEVKPTLSGLSASLFSFQLQGANSPLVSVRFQPNGDIEEATGSTGAALVYNKVGVWLSTVPPLNAADWEVNPTITAEDAGGGWVGLMNVFSTLDSTRTHTWTKDNLNNGTVDSTLSWELRQVSNPSNTAVRVGLTYSLEISP